MSWAVILQKSNWIVSECSYSRQENSGPNLLNTILFIHAFSCAVYGYRQGESRKQWGVFVVLIISKETLQLPVAFTHSANFNLSFSDKALEPLKDEML